MPQLSLSFLGAFHITLNGQPVRRFRLHATRALLVYLAVEADRPHRRERLASLLWPDVADGVALSRLRKALSDLRKAIGDSAETPFLHITRSTLQFNLDQSVWLDTAVFQQGAASHDPIQLEEAVALYRGPFLSGFSLKDSALFEEWMLVWQQRLAQVAATALYRLAVQRTEADEREQALGHLRRLLELEPWHGTAHHLLLHLLALDGRRAEALAHYESYRNALAQELYTEPSLELSTAYEQIRAGLETNLNLDNTLETEAEFPLFVAREEELTRLNQLLAQAQQGQGRVVFITGEAGAGKTALMGEFTRRALHTQGNILVADSTCSATDGLGDPFLPFRDILRLLLGDIEARRISAEISATQARRLWDNLPDALAALLAHGPDLIGSFINGEKLSLRAEALTAVSTQRRAHLAELVTQHTTGDQPPVDVQGQISAVLTAVAQSKTLILTIDDMQWADANTIALLFHLGRRLTGTRLLLLCAYRPIEVSLKQTQEHPLAKVVNELQRVTGELPLDLDRGNGRSFIANLLDTSPNRLDANFRETLYQRTGGNALFTVELLNHLQTYGGLKRDEQGYWLPDANLDWNQLPARIEAVIAERLRRVSSVWMSLLQAACVSGREFCASIVAEAIGLTEAEAIQALSGILSKQHQLVVATRVERVGQRRRLYYRFRHVLFETYLYQQLDTVTRTHLHETIGLAIEKEWEDEAKTEASSQLAHHFEAAELPLKAAEYWLYAGQHAIRLSAYKDGAHTLTHGLELLATIPASTEQARLEMKLQSALGAAMVFSGWGTNERTRVLERALALAQQAGSTSDLLYALHTIADLAQSRGESAKALAMSQEMLRLAEMSGIIWPQVRAHYTIGSTHYMKGNLAQARQHLEQALILGEAVAHESDVPAGGFDGDLSVLTWLTPITWLMGDTTDMSVYLERIDQIEHMEKPFALAQALAGGACPCLLWQGEPAATQAHRFIVKLRQVTEEWVPIFRPWADVYEGYWRVLYGPPDEMGSGIEQLQQGIHQWAALGARTGYVQQHLLLIEAYLRVDKMTLAKPLIEEALAFVAQSGHRALVAELYRLQGEVALVQGNKAQAVICFRQAIELAQAQGAVAWVRRAEVGLLNLGELARN